MWCRQRPKRTDTKKLRELFLQVTSIHTLKQKNISWLDLIAGKNNMAKKLL